MRADLLLGLVGSLITLVAAVRDAATPAAAREVRRVLGGGRRSAPWSSRSSRALLTGPPTSSASQVPANLLFFAASMLLLCVSIQHSYELGRLEERTRTLAEEVALLRLELEVRRENDGPVPDESSLAAASACPPPGEHAH